MKNKKHFKILKAAAITVMVLIALIWGAWLVVIPEALISSRIDDAMRGAGLRVEFDDLHKGIFYSLKANALTLYRQDLEILQLEDICVSLIKSPISLLRQRPAARFSATMAGGAIEGTATAHKDGPGDLSLTASGLKLSEVGIDRFLTGLSASGEASLDVSIVNGEGEARFKITGMKFLPYKYIGFTLPLDLLSRARGIVLIKGEGAEIKSATFEGDGLYARLTGATGRGRVNLTLELMPSPEIESSLPYFRMIEQYRTTSGHYAIPIQTGL